MSGGSPNPDARTHIPAPLVMHAHASSEDDTDSHEEFVRVLKELHAAELCANEEGLKRVCMPSSQKLLGHLLHGTRRLKQIHFAAANY